MQGAGNESRRFLPSAVILKFLLDQNGFNLYNVTFALYSCYKVSVDRQHMLSKVRVKSEPLNIRIFEQLHSIYT